MQSRKTPQPSIRRATHALLAACAALGLSRAVAAPLGEPHPAPREPGEVGGQAVDHWAPIPRPLPRCAGMTEPTPDDAVVAEGNGVRVTAAQVKGGVLRQPPLEQPRTSAAQAVRIEIDRQLREQEARRRGLDRDPEVAAGRKPLVQALLDQLSGQEAPPNERELRAWFDGHREEYLRPEKVSVDVFTGARGSPETPERELVEAMRRYRAQVLSAKVRPTGIWGRVEIFQTREELASALGAELAAAAFALTREGEATDVFTTPLGPAFALFNGRQAAISGFEQARGPIRDELLRRRGERAFTELSMRLSREVEVKIHEPLLARICLP